MSEAGKPKSFIVPCSMKSSAVTMRRTPRAWGASVWRRSVKWVSFGAALASGVGQALAASSSARSSGVRARRVARTRLASCSRLVALAIGAVMPGRADHPSQGHFGRPVSPSGRFCMRTPLPVASSAQLGPARAVATRGREKLRYRGWPAVDDRLGMRPAGVTRRRPPMARGAPRGGRCARSRARRRSRAAPAAGWRSTRACASCRSSRAPPRAPASGCRRAPPRRRRRAGSPWLARSRSAKLGANIRFVVGMLGERLRHVVEHRRADDAAGAPDPGDAGERQRPAELRRRRGEQAEALGVAGDLAGEQRLLEPVERRRRPRDAPGGPPNSAAPSRALARAGTRGCARRPPPRSWWRGRRGAAPRSPSSGRCPSGRRCRG